jgi:hypothetical protein
VVLGWADVSTPSWLGRAGCWCVGWGFRLAEVVLEALGDVGGEGVDVGHVGDGDSVPGSDVRFGPVGPSDHGGEVLAEVAADEVQDVYPFGEGSAVGLVLSTL